jgi:hypothetical protein
MKKRIRAIVLAGSILLTSGAALAQQSAKPLSNADIVSMMKAGIADDVVVGSIQVSGGNFDVSPDGLIALNKAGVTMRVMEAMIGSAVPRPPDPTPPAPLAAGPAASAAGGMTRTVAALVPPGFGAVTTNAFVGGAPPQYGGQMPGQFPGQFPGQMPGMPGGFPGMEPQPTVNFVSDTTSTPLFTERLQSIEEVSKGVSSGNMSGGAALNQMMSAGAVDVSNRMLNGTGAASASAGINVLGGLLTRKSAVSTYVWALRGKLSSNIVPGRHPSFEVSFADIPGVDPDHFEAHIVRLESTKTNFRLIGATKVTNQSSANNGAFGMVYSSFLEHEVETEKKATEPGHLRVAPAKDLPPGEYAVVLRPVSAKKTFSGDAVSRNDGEGLLFNAAWSFSVK